MKLSAVLLAGGESRRMGADKATAVFRGQPLWRHQIDLLRAMNPLEILISARTDPRWRPPDTAFIPDEVSLRGPLGGLAAALQRMKGTHLLALAVDMPLMSVSFLKSMVATTETKQGILPKIGERAEPLAAIYPVRCSAAISAALRGDDWSLQPLAENLVRSGHLRVLEVKSADEPLFCSLNTPEDLLAQA